MIGRTSVALIALSTLSVWFPHASLGENTSWIWAKRFSVPQSPDPVEITGAKDALFCGITTIGFTKSFDHNSGPECEIGFIDGKWQAKISDDGIKCTVSCLILQTPP